MMDAIDVKPYLVGMTGKDIPIGKYAAGDVMLFSMVKQQQDVFSGRVQREYAKIIEAKTPKPKR